MTGTITKPAIIAKAPALIGDCKIAGKIGRANIFAVIKKVANKKHAQQEKVVIFFE